jgi:hypothetical protein
MMGSKYRACYVVYVMLQQEQVKGMALWMLGAWKIKGRRMGARNVQCSLCGQGISRCGKIQVIGGEVREMWTSSQEQVL